MLVRIALLYVVATIGRVAQLAALCVIALKALGPLGGVALAYSWPLHRCAVARHALSRAGSRIADAPSFENRHALDAMRKSALPARPGVHGLKLIVAMSRRNACNR